MALTTVSNGNTINASDVNQMINIIKQPSGGQEKGTYYLGNPGYTSGANCSIYVPSLSKVTTPVSVSVDASLGTTTGFTTSTPSTDLPTKGGFRIYDTTSGAQTNPAAQGNWTIQY